MVRRQSVRLTIPSSEDFEWDDSYLSVPYDAVYWTIDVLQGCLVQWKNEEGCAQNEEIWSALMAAAAHALHGLVLAYTGSRSTRADELPDQIADFLRWRGARETLERLRSRQETAYIVDALLALHEESERQADRHGTHPRAGLALTRPCSVGSRSSSPPSTSRS
jgi:hypothetical protein